MLLWVKLLHEESSIDRPSQAPPEGFRSLDALNGSVQSRGLQVDERHWLVMSTPEWGACPDAVKAAAYQSALDTGWSDAAISGIVTKNYPLMDDEMMQFVLDSLKDLAKRYPVSFTTE